MRAPQPLAAGHRLESFDSGEPSLDDWLRRRALKNQENGSSRTYVVCQGQDVIGYYCLSAGAIGHAEAPGNLKRNRPDPIPVIVLGRLAIHSAYHQQRMGTALLRDAILRTLQAAEVAEQAKRFYRSRGFVESPVQPMTLCLPLHTVHATLDQAGHWTGLRPDPRQ